MVVPNASGDDHRLPDAEPLDQLLEIARLVDQREAVVGELRAGVAAPVVGEAAMIARKLRELVLPVFQAVDLAVDEDEIGPFPLHLVVEIAAVDIDSRHVITLTILLDGLRQPRHALSTHDRGASIDPSDGPFLGKCTIVRERDIHRAGSRSKRR